MAIGDHETNSRINTLMGFIRAGHSVFDLRKSFSNPDFDELFSIAKARITNAKSKKLPENFFFNENDLRFATNQAVAAYRAKRLACDTIVDAGCGIGMQSIAFAKTCRRVIAIDIDAGKVEYAKLNARAAGVSNIDFHVGDALNFGDKVAKADIIFCDPERPAAESERKTSSLSPNPEALIKTLSHLTKNFCIEFPPQIKEIPFDCEKEYVSFNHELNRLNLYLGELRKSETSAAILPEGTVLSESDEENIFAYASPQEYFYEIDAAVVKAGLSARINGNGLFYYSEYLTSESVVKSDFFKASYKILKLLANQNLSIKEELGRQDAAKVVLHGSIKQEEYWPQRKFFEKGLVGAKTIHLFIAGEDALICEKI